LGRAKVKGLDIWPKAATLTALAPFATAVQTVLMTNALPPRFPVSAAQIDAVVAQFYIEIRHHPGLGPVFAAHITDWPEHEAKIARFWRNAILHERGYDGNPFAVHRQAGNVRPGMFETWLGLFDSVLKRKLPAEVADSWSELAHRIGRGLRAGVVDRADANGVPILR
jgi:hemoglobin